MATIKVANFHYLFTFAKQGGFTLPGTRIRPDMKQFMRPDEDIRFHLSDLHEQFGILSFYFDTDRGADDGINLAFEITINGTSKHSFAFRGEVTTCFQLQVGGLKNGDNVLTFNMTKGGKITSFDPDRSLGGKGVAHFSNMCLTYHRNVTV